MSLHGNWLDLIIIIFLCLYAANGLRRGFLTLAAEMATFILSFLIALRFYPLTSSLLVSNFSLAPTLANAIGFVVLALVVETVLVAFVTIVYTRLPDNLFNSKINHLFGLIPGLIDGLILLAFALSVALALPISPQVKSDILASKIGSALVAQTHSLEQALNQIFGAAIESSLDFLTVKTGSSQNIDLHFHTTDYTLDQQSENQMLSLINQERTSHNLKPLTLDLKLQALARAHSQDMFARGYFSHVDPDTHDPFDRMRAANISYSAAGENLAYAPTVTIAHQGLMNSPGHRTNILNPDFGHVGVGVIDAGIYGRMFTQEFTN